MNTTAPTAQDAASRARGAAGDALEGLNLDADVDVTITGNLVVLTIAFTTHITDAEYDRATRLINDELTISLNGLRKKGLTALVDAVIIRARVHA